MTTTSEAPLENRTLNLDGHVFVQSTEAISDFVRIIVHDAGEIHNAERRKHTRYPVNLPATMTPLNDEFRIADGPIDAVVRDISEGGVCCFGTHNTNHPFVAIEYQRGKRQLKAVFRVIRIQQFYGIFNIAGKFVAVFHHPDESTH